MNVKKLIASGLALACLATVSTNALAQSKQQRTCTNSAANVMTLAYDKRKLDCADLGVLTLKEINAKGWRIVQLMASNSYQSGTGWTVLIEK